MQLKELNLLVNQLQIAITSLRTSYGVLHNYISEANPAKEIPAPIVQLENDYAQLLGTIAKFAEARERLYKISY